MYQKDVTKGLCLLVWDVGGGCNLEEDCIAKGCVWFGI